VYEVWIVTVGTRNVSAVNVVVDGMDSAPKLDTRISRLPFLRTWDGTVMVGRRSLGIDSEVSPYLRG
jgi:hypothetical protein